MSESKKLINVSRLSGGLKATSWMNFSESGASFTTTHFTSIIKSQKGFSESTSFTQHELLDIALLAEEEFEKLNTNQTSLVNSEDEP